VAFGEQLVHRLVHGFCGFVTRLRGPAGKGSAAREALIKD